MANGSGSAGGGGIVTSLGNYLVKIGINADDVAKGVALANKSLGSFKNWIKSTTPELIKWSITIPLIEKGVKLFGTSLIAAGIALKALGESANQVYQRTQVLNTVLLTVGRNAGFTSAQITSARDAITKMGVTTQEADSAVIRLTQSEISLAKGTELARVAQDLAVVSGQNSSEAYSIIIDAIATFNPMLLRQFGLTKTLTEVQEDYAKKLNKTTNSLTQTEVKMAIANYTLQEGKKAAGNYVAAMDDVGKKVSSLPRLFEELNNEIGKNSIAGYKVFIDVIYDLLDSLLKLPKPMRDFASGFIAFGGIAFPIIGTLTLLVAGITSLGLALTGITFVLGLLAPLLAAGAGALVVWITNTFTSSAVTQNLISVFAKLAATSTVVAGAINMQTGAINKDAIAKLFNMQVTGALTTKTLVAGLVAKSFTGVWTILTSAFKTGTQIILGLGSGIAKLAGSLTLTTGALALFIAGFAILWKITKDMEKETARLEATLRREMEQMRENKSVHEKYLSTMLAINDTTVMNNSVISERIKLVRTLGITTEDINADYMSLNATLAEHKDKYTALSNIQKQVEENKRNRIKLQMDVHTQDGKELAITDLNIVQEQYLMKLLITSSANLAKQVGYWKSKVEEEEKDVVALMKLRDAMQQAGVEIDRWNILLGQSAEAYKFGRLGIEELTQISIDYANKATELFTNNTMEAKEFVKVQFQKADSVKNLTEVTQNEAESRLKFEVETGKKSKKELTDLYIQQYSDMALAEQKYALENKPIVRARFDEKIQGLHKERTALEENAATALKLQSIGIDNSVKIATQEKELEDSKLKLKDEKDVKLQAQLKDTIVFQEKGLKDLKSVNVKYIQDELQLNKDKVTELENQRDVILKSTIWSEQQMLAAKQKANSAFLQAEKDTNDVRRQNLDQQLQLNIISETEYYKKRDEIRARDMQLAGADEDKQRQLRFDKELQDREQKNKKMERSQAAMNRFFESADMFSLDTRLMQTQDYYDKINEAKQRYMNDYKVSLADINNIGSKASQMWVEYAKKYKISMKDAINVVTFSVEGYFQHYAKLLQHQYDMTEGVTKKENMRMLQFSEERSKLYDTVSNAYVVSFQGALNVNEKAVKEFTNRKLAMEKQTFDYEMNMGKERLQNELDNINETMRAAKNKLATLVKGSADYQKNYQATIDKIKGIEKSAFDMKMQLIELEDNKRKKSQENRLSFEEKMNTYIYEQTHTAQQQAEKELYEEVKRYENAGGNIVKAYDYINLKLREIWKTTEQTMTKATDNMVDGVKDLNQNLTQTATAAGGAGKQTESWYKGVESFKSVSDFGAAPKFGGPVRNLDMPGGRLDTQKAGWGTGISTKDAWGTGVSAKGGFGFQGIEDIMSGKGGSNTAEALLATNKTALDKQDEQIKVSKEIRDALAKKEYKSTAELQTDLYKVGDRTNIVNTNETPAAKRN